MADRSTREQAAPADTVRPVLRPASDDIAKELVLLRQRDGMTMQKLRQRCPALLQLDVTSAELHRRQLAPSDRHVAAYEMIKCACNAFMPRTDLARIVTHTLNLPGSEQLLDARRGRLQEELFLSEKAYRRLEEEAFAHLAGALVAADQSPCDSLPGDHLKQFEFDLRVTASSEQLLEILKLLTLERRQSIRDELGARLMALLPGAQSALTGATLTNLAGPWAQARRILAGVLTKAWPPRAATPTSDLELFSASALSDLLLSNLLDVDYQHALTATSEQESFQHLTLTETSNRATRPSSEFLRLKTINILQLGAQIERIELDDRWTTILGDTQDNHALLRVT